MNSIAITMSPTHKKKILVELDADKFERLAAHLGLFNEGFLSSLDKAEKDYKNGKIKQISSLRQLRKQCL